MILASLMPGTAFAQRDTDCSITGHVLDKNKGEFRDSNYIYGPTLPRTVILGTTLRF